MSMPAAVLAPQEATSEPIQPLRGPYRRYAMGLLLAISMVNYLDRQVINILAEPIKQSLNLADWQLGMLTGLAFGLLYTLLGLPIARLAERGNRPLIIATACAVWSGFTVLCGTVQTFAQLALARVGVGVGEAGCTPPSHSLIMDYAPAERRASSLAFYGLGAPVGGLLGMAFGGLIADAYGWRAAFLMAGLPGIILAVLVLTTLREPRRHGRAAPAVVRQTSVREMLDLVGPKRSYWLLLAAITGYVFIMYGYAPFTASFYLRNHAAELTQATGAIGARLGFNLGSVGFLGFAIGLQTGVFGALGTFLGGILADRLGPADPRRYLYLPALSILCAVPLLVGVFTVSSLTVSLILLGLGLLVLHVWYGPAYTAWFSLVPGNMRATNSALNLFLANLLGLGLAPLLVGGLSDFYGATMGEGEGIRWALVSLMGIGLITGLLFWLAAKTFREDMEV